ncbi:general secretion pathway protein GspB [Roseateles sp.]|uniref:general secretion pathway protein GspB n=1 Tax=Roseateles sp. TaxID=1971397 RepID=UPI00286B386C|nr:general secretion pathway protein GspB [Roseateles sp.]
MSYILDALRKADAERERGTVPTLQSHAAHADPGAQARLRAQAGPAWGRTALIAALVILLVVVGFLVAPWLRPEPAPLTPLTPPAAPVNEALVMAPARQAPLTPSLRAPPPAAVEALPDPKPSAAAPPAAKAAEAAILKLAELPEATRKALPAIATSGAMYSDTPANRMLIINGQLLHEGDKIAPELLLERIELKSAVLVFKGQRFRINY